MLTLFCHVSIHFQIPQVHTLAPRVWPGLPLRAIVQPQGWILSGSRWALYPHCQIQAPSRNDWRLCNQRCTASACEHDWHLLLFWLLMPHMTHYPIIWLPHPGIGNQTGQAFLFLSHLGMLPEQYPTILSLLSYSAWTISTVSPDHWILGICPLFPLSRHTSAPLLVPFCDLEI